MKITINYPYNLTKMVKDFKVNSKIHRTKQLKKHKENDTKTNIIKFLKIVINRKPFQISRRKRQIT